MEDSMQPDPTTGTVEIMPLVVADLMARREQGIKTYGRPLQANNGRDALQDLYEELLDACCYIKQAMIERNSKTCEHYETIEGQDIGCCEALRETCDLNGFRPCERK